LILIAILSRPTIDWSMRMIFLYIRELPFLMFDRGERWTFSLISTIEIMGWIKFDLVDRINLLDLGITLIPWTLRNHLYNRVTHMGMMELCISMRQIGGTTKLLVLLMSVYYKMLKLISALEIMTSKLYIFKKIYKDRSKVGLVHRRTPYIM
jgi:hypothetical protein